VDFQHAEQAKQTIYLNERIIFHADNAQKDFPKKAKKGVFSSLNFRKVMLLPGPMEVTCWHRAKNRV